MRYFYFRLLQPTWSRLIGHCLALIFSVLLEGIKKLVLRLGSLNQKHASLFIFCGFIYQSILVFEVLTKPIVLKKSVTKRILHEICRFLSLAI